ncbi:MAG: BamA/TamA family outer membrane protein [Flavobacteriaceae bacterium]
MTHTLAKISLFLGLLLLIISCDTVRNVPETEYLLTNNIVVIDSLDSNDARINSLLYQQPNNKVLGIPLSLHFYNIANPQPDSTFQKWLHKKPKREQRMVNFYSKKQVDKMDSSYVGINKWIQKTGNKPVIIDEKKIKKSLDRLEKHYSSFGWFNAKASYSIEKTDNKRATVTYKINRHKPYKIGTIEEKISSPVVDSLYQLTKKNSFIVKDKQYASKDFNIERDRLSIQFRNSGLFYFDQSYIEFEADSVNTNHNVNITYILPDRKIKKNDTTHTEPFKVHYVNEVKIITDYNYKNRNSVFTDSTSYNGYKLYSYDKLKFFPKSITDAISISPGKIFRDLERSQTYSQVSDLKIFKYPKISYIEDPNDSTGTGLIATVLLTPRKKYSLGLDLDAFTSTIQQFGIGFKASFSIRNVFKRAEVFEISAKGRVGASKDAGNESSRFFNNSDVGADMKLSFPRIIFPIKTEKFIPKYMSPLTSATVGFSNQNNIGLDRQNINTIYNYRWKPKKARTNQIDLLNLQFVRNLNPENYYKVYTSSYNSLNKIAIDTGYDFEDNTEPLELSIPDETEDFIDLALSEDNGLDINDEQQQEVLDIAQRQSRLSENNLIVSANYTWTRDTRDNINDNKFYRLRWKVESAGVLLKGIASTFNLDKDEFGNYVIGDIVFSQYIKFEAEYIKHWQINNNIFAFRSFAGIAIPYGNSNNIPFTRSYFAGGSNDNRGWEAYKLGPGSSGGILDFNEANFKLAFNGEYRFKIFGPFNGALFVDAGNIWNTLDDITDPAYTFTSLKDLEDIAIGSGFGIRYDFGFAVFRLDLGFKTYDPAYQKGERWLKDYNFGNAVYNIGINYPF